MMRKSKRKGSVKRYAQICFWPLEEIHCRWRLNSNKEVIQTYHCWLTDSGVQHISEKRKYPEGHLRFSLLNYYFALSRRRLVSGRIHKNQRQTDISGENQHDQRQQYKTNDAQFRLFTQIPKGQHHACHCHYQQ